MLKSIINHITQQILRFTLPLTIFLIPLFFLPNTADFFTTNKQLILTIITALALIAWSFKMISRGQLRLTLSPALIPISILSLIYLASALLQSPNPIINLLARPIPSLP